MEPGREILSSTASVSRLITTHGLPLVVDIIAAVTGIHLVDASLLKRVDSGDTLTYTQYGTSFMATTQNPNQTWTA